MNRDTLNILADAISDVGSWQWWYTKDDMFQLEFRDVQLYDETKAEKEAHTTDVIAVRFFGNVFAVFLDNLENDDPEKKWYERFYDDEIQAVEIEAYELEFDNAEYAGKVYDSFVNKTPMKQFDGVSAFLSARHIIAAKCGDKGFVAGGERMVIVNQKGEYKEEDIEYASRRWWEYWRDYWRLRGTPEAYQKDWACEVCIPVDTNNPQGEWYEGA